jgi:hypothetical protein
VSEGDSLKIVGVFPEIATDGTPLKTISEFSAAGTLKDKCVNRRGHVIKVGRSPAATWGLVSLISLSVLQQANEEPAFGFRTFVKKEAVRPGSLKMHVTVGVRKAIFVSSMPHPDETKCLR